jgi:hypothetical protein
MIMTASIMLPLGTSAADVIATSEAKNLVCVGQMLRLSAQHDNNSKRTRQVGSEAIACIRGEK